MDTHDAGSPAPTVVVEPAPGTVEPDWLAALDAQTPAVFRYRVPHTRGLWMHHAVRAVHDKVCGLVTPTLVRGGCQPQVRHSDPYHLRDPNRRDTHGSVWTELSPVTAAYVEKYVTHPRQRNGAPVVDVYEQHGTQVVTHALWVSSGTTGRAADAREILECRLATWLWPRRFAYPGGSHQARTTLRRARVYADDEGAAARLVHGLVTTPDPTYGGDDHLTRRRLNRHTRTTWPLLFYNIPDHIDVHVDVADVLVNSPYTDAEVLVDPNADVLAVYAVVERTQAAWESLHYRRLYEVWFAQYVRKLGTDIARSI